MPKAPAIIPNGRFNLLIDPELHTRVTLHLWSEVEGKVPRGAFKDFFEARIREYFTQVPLTLPSGRRIWGDDATIGELARLLDPDTTLDIPGA